MTLRAIICGLWAFCVPGLAQAGVDLKFPEGAQQRFDQSEISATYLLPVGPYADGKIDTVPTEGAVERQVWRTAAARVMTLDLISPIREQLKQQGYTVLYECDTRECGGFDFRFQADVIAEPYMHVDLGDFRYLAAQKGAPADEDFVSVLVSCSSDRGFIQVTHIGEPTLVEDQVAMSSKQAGLTTAIMDESDIGGQLSASGSAVLEGLVFPKGSSTLSGDVAGSLQALSAYLNDNPGSKVVLVGHTDAEGSLEGNIALSKKRAASVMESLVATFGVDADQVSAEGVGFLAPRATNATEAGRERNRRVEVVLTQLP